MCIFNLFISKELENLPMKLAEKSIYAGIECAYDNIQKAFNVYDAKYRMVFRDDEPSVLPYLFCSTCRQFFRFFKLDPKGAVRKNSTTNVVNHRCSKAQILVDESIKNYQAPIGMPSEMRAELSDIIAELIAEKPTLSQLATVDFANKLLSRAQGCVLRIGRKVNFNFDRKSIGSKIIKFGQEVKAMNLKMFNENATSSTVIFDHWSKNGFNFFGAIGRTFLDDSSLVENCLGFFIANADKTSQGYLKDLDSIIASQNIKVPMMTDNCSTMVKAGKISNKFRKVFCASHQLAKIDDKIHQVEAIKNVDKQLTKLNAFFNYRHQKYNLNRKPLTSTSDTRPWRSHVLNFEVTLANYSQYEVLKKDFGSKFPDLPDKIQLLKINELQVKLCSNFDQLEKKEANLLDHLRVYVNVIKLGCEKNTTDLVGNTLRDIISSKKITDCFLSDDSLAFAILNKVNLNFLFGQMEHINCDDLKSRAKDHIMEIGKRIDNSDHTPKQKR